MTSADLSAVADYLDEYLDVQQALLDVMTAKLDVRTKRGLEEARALDAREAELVERLKACVEKRQGLLADPELNAAGEPTLRRLAESVENADEDQADLNLFLRFDAAEKNNRELRMRSVSAWVLAQRSVVHWSQMLEIVASQGQNVPTYKRDRKLRSRGALMNQEG
ncbi:MAG TPA: hypothetical protein VGN57_11385 [Pirellulaceae bacterium]|jgi:hypothetical protein|nr:hypothetical protein [Pirellulaceae bacterium]